jgi:hypothetical protein
LLFPSTTRSLTGQDLLADSALINQTTHPPVWQGVHPPFCHNPTAWIICQGTCFFFSIPFSLTHYGSSVLPSATIHPHTISYRHYPPFLPSPLTLGWVRRSVSPCLLARSPTGGHRRLGASHLWVLPVPSTVPFRAHQLSGSSNSQCSTFLSRTRVPCVWELHITQTLRHQPPYLHRSPGFSTSH